jgi:hypothetical protein
MVRAQLTYAVGMDMVRYGRFVAHMMLEAMQETGISSMSMLEEMDAFGMDYPFHRLDLPGIGWRNVFRRLKARGYTDEEITEGTGLLRLGLPPSGTSDWSTDRLNDQT